MSSRKNRIERRLGMFEEDIEKLDQLFPDTDIFGENTARRPLKYMYEIQYLLQNEASDSHDHLAQRYQDVCEEYEEFRAKYSPEYEEVLLDELDALVDDYVRKICMFDNFEPNSFEERFSVRDSIEIIISYLTEEAGFQREQMSELQARVNALDDVFKCLCRRYIETILEEFPHISKDYMPERFWWRHPQQLREDSSNID